MTRILSTLKHNELLRDIEIAVAFLIISSAFVKALYHLIRHDDFIETSKKNDKYYYKKFVACGSISINYYLIFCLFINSKAIK